MGTQPSFNTPVPPPVCANDRLGGNVPVMVALSDGELAANSASGVGGGNQSVLSASSSGTQQHGDKKR